MPRSRAHTEKRGKREEISLYIHIHTRPALVQVFARAYARVCMCARSRRRPAWFTAPDSLRFLHRGVLPPQTSCTLGSQCGFLSDWPARVPLPGDRFLSRVLDRLRGGAQSRSSVVLVGEFTGFPPSGRSFVRSCISSPRGHFHGSPL